jgi:23S rRNA (pseudouridine1915-N3)-methyltransferase
MPIQLICVGQRMPAWVDEGFKAYQKRLSRPWNLELSELPVAKRGKNPDIARCRAEEGEKLLAAAHGSLRIALDEHGQLWDSLKLSRQLAKGLQTHAKISLLVGGPDGLAPHCLHQADALWSLSPLTLPHALVRVVVAEQVYRAWSLAHNHPYHRA